MGNQVRPVLHVGLCEEVLKQYPDNHFDSCVTDPPYAINFMNKHWDYEIPSVTTWKEILRVMKPGAYLLSFGGSRTFHRLAVNIEDAGFDIRDTILWLYGSGFPKSTNIAKAIDRAEGVEPTQVGMRQHPTLKDPDKLEEPAGASHGVNQWAREWPLTAGTSELAKKWDGWGTALKPAFEPIVVARKPLIGTLVENIKAYGTGAMNIDACRVPGEPWSFGTQTDLRGGGYGSKRPSEGDVLARNVVGGENGRWPANVIHDGSDEATQGFPYQKSGAMTKPYEYTNSGHSLGAPAGATRSLHDSNEGSAARFFYCAKTSREDRNEGLDAFEKKPVNWSSGDQNPGSFQSDGTDRSSENYHPTVKPTELMRYLVKLVTRREALCLDPFMGSGSTGKGATYEHVNFVGIDKDPEFISIAQARIEFAFRNRDNQISLF